jgi:aminopeptidase N
MEVVAQPYTSEAFAKAWEAFTIPAYRAALIDHFGSQLTRPDQERAFSESKPEVLKALLRQIGPLEDWMKPYMVSLLDGPGYQLREAALYRLWIAFPDDRKEFLELTYTNGSMTSELFGQLWYMLAVFTTDFRTPGERLSFLEALRATTAPGNPREVRRNGFSLLQEIDGLTPTNLRDLAGASEHHSWQFRIFARRLLDALMESRPDPDFWQNIAESFSKETHPYLYKKVAEL